MDTQTLYCPQCGAVLISVSRRADYFCKGCHGAVAVIDETFALWMIDLRDPETLITLESLTHPEQESVNEPFSGA